MVDLLGLEPRTLGLRGLCSNRLSYRSRWLGQQDSNLRMSDSESDALPLGDTPTKSCSLYTKALKVKIFSKNKIRPKSTKRTDFFDVFLILIYSFAIIKNSKCHQIFIISEFFASFVIDFIITIPINRVIVGIISQNDVMSFFRVGWVFKMYLYQIIARIYLICTISWNRTMIFNACLGEKT